MSLLQAAQAFSRVVAPDMPGFGQAEKPVDFDYTVSGYARATFLRQGSPHS